MTGRVDTQRRLSAPEVAALRAAAERSRVLVVGSLNHDEILVADHDPGDEGAVMVRHSTTAPGGHAGNCASALAALGVRVSLLAAVGDDPTGDLLLADLAAHQVDAAGVARIPGVPTGRVIIPVFGDKHFMLLLRGANEQLSAHHVERALLADFDALMLFDPSPQALQQVFISAADLDIFWTPGGIYSQQPAQHRHLPSCRAVFVNRSEWRSIRDGLPPGALADTEIIQTLGAEGAIAHRGSAEPVSAAGESVTQLDPTGAGDAFAAAYLLATLAGLPVSRRLATANIAGALAVTAIGARGRLCTLADLAGWP